jgi:hypothetical protein
MKRVYIAFERFAQDGQVFTDPDGCSYLRPHSHPLLAGKEFCNPTEAVQLISDYNIENPKNRFKGEVIFQEVIIYS